jgi:hypothetical protein
VKFSTIALPGRTPVAIRQARSINLAWTFVHGIQHRGEAIQLCLSGACEPTKEFVISTGQMLVCGGVWPATGTIDASLTTHVELLNATSHLVRMMELHDYHAVLLIW